MTIHSHFFPLFSKSFSPSFEQIPISFAYDLSTTPFLPFPIQSHSKSNPPIHPKIPRSLIDPPYLSSSRNHTIAFLEKIFNPIVNHTGFTFEERCLDTAGRQPVLSLNPNRNHCISSRCEYDRRCNQGTTTLRYRPLGIFHSRSNDSSFRNLCTFVTEEFSLPFFSLSPPFFYSTARISRERINRGSFEQLARN